MATMVDILDAVDLMSEGVAIHLILDIADRFGLRVWCYSTNDVLDCAEDLEVELTKEEAADILDSISFDGQAIAEEIRDLIEKRQEG